LIVRNCPKIVAITGEMMRFTVKSREEDEALNRVIILKIN
jgi:histidinol-phosphate/aromatic aminotransferase/cobyric acid decarboxylase-like protein